MRQIGVDLKSYQFDYIGQYFQKFQELVDADLDASMKRIYNTEQYISGLFEKSTKIT